MPKLKMLTAMLVISVAPVATGPVDAAESVPILAGDIESLRGQNAELLKNLGRLLDESSFDSKSITNLRASINNVGQQLARMKESINLRLARRGAAHRASADDDITGAYEIMLDKINNEQREIEALVKSITAIEKYLGAVGVEHQ